MTSGAPRKSSLMKRSLAVVVGCGCDEGEGDVSMETVFKPRRRLHHPDVDCVSCTELLIWLVADVLSPHTFALAQLQFQCS